MLTNIDFGSSLGNFIDELPSLSFSNPLISSTLFSLMLALWSSSSFLGLTSSVSGSKMSPGILASIFGSDKVEEVIGGGWAGGLSMSKMDFGGFIEVTGEGGIGGGGGLGSLGGNGGCWGGSGGIEGFTVSKWGCFIFCCHLGSCPVMIFW